MWLHYTTCSCSNLDYLNFDWWPLCCSWMQNIKCPGKNNAFILFKVKNNAVILFKVKNNAFILFKLFWTGLGLRSTKDRLFNLHTLCSLFSAIPAVIIRFFSPMKLPLMWSLLCSLTNISTTCCLQVGQKSTSECVDVRKISFLVFLSPSQLHFSVNFDWTVTILCSLIATTTWQVKVCTDNSNII